MGQGSMEAQDNSRKQNAEKLKAVSYRYFAICKRWRRDSKIDYQGFPSFVLEGRIHRSQVLQRLVQEATQQSPVPSGRDENQIKIKLQSNIIIGIKLRRSDL